MNILWLTNVAMPEASLLMNERPTPFGGWFAGASVALANKDNIKLSIAFPKKGLNDVVILKGEKITFYAFPPVSEKDVRFNIQNTYLKKILNETNHDIVHIFGTEYAHTLAMVNACQKEKVVISIQGLTSVISKHYMAGLPINVQNRFTIRDFIKQDNLRQQQNKFIKRGAFEIKALQKVKHIIGRTTWDKACSFQINPDAQYHFCNEILRDEFYKYCWDIKKCEKHSIFVSQGSYPIKGLHFMLEAMPLILKSFPDTTLYISGQNITKSDTLKEKLKMSSYGKYIKELIERCDLEKIVVFTGILDEKQMCQRFLKSHVFVSSSIVENESNSLSEAKIMGVPSVASYVGGVTDRIEHGKDGFFYQHDAPYMLAYYVCKIFENEDLAISFSKKAKINAQKTNNIKINIQTLKRIYKEIYKKSL